MARAKNGRPPKAAKDRAKWSFGRRVALGDLTYRQCKGARLKRVDRHGVPFLGVADIAGLLWCEIQATMSQHETQSGYVDAAWQDDHRNGEARVKRDPGSRLSPTVVRFSTTDSPIIGGQLAQALYARRYDSMRRHWDFGEFFVIGVPDGLGKDFVYEFKYSKYPRSRPTFITAMAQANIYGTLFHKRRLRIHFAGPDGFEKTVEGDVREADAANLIRRSWALLRGHDDFHKPESWKCEPCRYRSICPVPAGNRVPTGAEIRRLFPKRTIRRATGKMGTE